MTLNHLPELTLTAQFGQFCRPQSLPNPSVGKRKSNTSIRPARGTAILAFFTCCSSPGWKVNCHRGQGGSPWGTQPGELLLKLIHLCVVSQRCPKLPWGMNAIRYLWDCWAIAGRTNRNPCLCPKGECLIILLWKKAAGACPKVQRFINILNLYDVSTLNIDRWWRKKPFLYWDHYLIIAEATECDICHSYCISHGKTEVVVYLIPHIQVYFFRVRNFIKTDLLFSK